MSSSAYIVEDEPALVRRLDDYLAGLAQRLGDSPAATATQSLVLSGGYGRGEGGVFRGESGEAELYNDLEFYLLMRDGADEAPVAAWCEKEEREGTAELGIDVEFKRLPMAALREGEPSMFYYDLLQGHRLTWGDANWRDGLRSELSRADKIPLHEATRLLFNRGSGLWFSRCALAKDDERVTSGFVERNHAKVRLALGDAVIAANGRYHHFCRTRNEHVHGPLPHTPPDWPQLIDWHDQGVDFKLRPRHVATGKADLEEQQTQLAGAWLRTFLWLESRRLGRTFADASAYANDGGRLFPETPRLRNVALRLRDKKNRGGALPGWTDYPRAALQRALTLGVDPTNEPDSSAMARLLVTPSPSHWPDLEPAYARWWAYYN